MINFAQPQDEGFTGRDLAAFVAMPKEFAKEHPDVYAKIIAQLALDKSLKAQLDIMAMVTGTSLMHIIDVADGLVPDDDGDDRSYMEEDDL